VLGYLHAPPTIDPLRSVDRRPILALTSSILEYAENGAPVRIESDALLLNSSKIDLLEAASEADLGLSTNVDLGTKPDPRAKDMTGSN